MSFEMTVTLRKYKDDTTTLGNNWALFPLVPQRRDDLLYNRIAMSHLIKLPCGPNCSLNYKEFKYLLHSVKLFLLSYNGAFVILLMSVLLFCLFTLLAY